MAPTPQSPYLEGRNKGDIPDKKLFTELSKLSVQATVGEKSTGLGLAISRRIVEALDGEFG